MSEATNVTGATEKKEPFSIVIEENEKFAHIMDSKFMSSGELCGVISSLLKNVYADFEGCVLEIPQGTNVPTISVFFNHKEIRPDSVLPAACSKDVTDNKTKNATLRSTRVFQNRLINGDHFYLTDEGKEGLESLVMDNRNFYNKNRSINWGKITAEVADSTTYGAPMPPMQYTKVSFLDPAKLMELIFGKKDEDGTTWVYGVRIIRSVPTVSMFGSTAANSFMLAVERVCEEEVIRLSQQMGLAVSSGLNIIR